MRNLFSFLKRVILFFFGMGITQLGIALFLKTGIGSDPFTIFTQGLARQLNTTELRNLDMVERIAGKPEITQGVANMIILVCLFVIILTIDRKRINIGTLICVVGVGPIIDLGVKIISYFPVESYHIGIRMLLVVLGCFIIAIGFSIVSASNLGIAPNDIIPFLIVDRVIVEYKWIRILYDAVFLIGGYSLGGVIGIGTVIAMLAQGPLIQLCLPYGAKLVRFIVNKKAQDEQIDPVFVRFQE